MVSWYFDKGDMEMCEFCKKIHKENEILAYDCIYETSTGKKILLIDTGDSFNMATMEVTHCPMCGRKLV